MSQRSQRNSSQSTGTAATAQTAATTDETMIHRLLQDAEVASEQYSIEDATVDEWGRESFPASDPPQNY